MVRIGVDGFNLAMPRGTGVATYGRVLTQALASAGHAVDLLYGLPIDPGMSEHLREIVFFDSLDLEKGPRRPGVLSQAWWREFRQGKKPLDAASIPITGRVVADSFDGRMPTFDRIFNVQNLFSVAERHYRRTRRFLTVRLPSPPAIMHWTYPVPVRVQDARNIYTVHDLVPLRLPYTTLDNKQAYTDLIQGCLKWGDHICTVSEASRHDIVDCFNVSADRISNTYQSITPPSHAPVADELGAWLTGLFGLQPQGYLLFFGALEPKKNIGRLLEAYLASGIETPLVIVGSRSWKSENELRLIQGEPGSKPLFGARNVVQLGYMPAEWLSRLITGARAVSFPSLYEGFGLPVVEAMQRGVPVLTSTTSSLPEIAGEAALLVDPYNVAEITQALRRLDEDAGLRARLSAAGPIQAARFGMIPYQARLDAMYDATVRSEAR